MVGRGWWSCHQRPALGACCAFWNWCVDTCCVIICSAVNRSVHTAPMTAVNQVHLWAQTAHSIGVWYSDAMICHLIEINFEMFVKGIITLKLLQTCFKVFNEIQKQMLGWMCKTISVDCEHVCWAEGKIFSATLHHTKLLYDFKDLWTTFMGLYCAFWSLTLSLYRKEHLWQTISVDTVNWN